MGKTAFAGPVYGAKSQIASVSRALASTGGSTALIGSFVVPSGEDWFVTELGAYCSTCSSGGNTITVKSEGGSTTGANREWGDGSNSTKAQTIGSVTWGTSTTGPLLGIVTKSAGEYEGLWVPTGSTVRVLLSSAAEAVANINVSLRGYVRFINSTRAE